MKKSWGIFFMITGMLMGFHLLFNVYIPNVMPTEADINELSMVRQAHHERDVQAHHERDVQAHHERDVQAHHERDVRLTMSGGPLVLSGKDPTTTGDGKEPLVLNLSKDEKIKRATHLFAVPEGLKAEVEFWKKVYTQYTNDQAVLHDPNNLGKIYGVIKLPHCNEPPTKECLQGREDAIEEEKGKLGFRKENDIKQRISHHRTIAPLHQIRAQAGQRDKFIAGIISSRDFLPHIENVFAQYSIPKEISRLPFVESMFNLSARSSAGASGIWQLMPKTARMLGLKVTKNTDERNDPVKATAAAAQHLLRDYNRLGSWTLAINAYNAGPGRLANAVNVLGTKDIVKIIKNYYHPAYGFAARNFYPEFLAALDAYENRHVYFKEELR